MLTGMGDAVEWRMVLNGSVVCRVPSNDISLCYAYRLIEYVTCYLKLITLFMLFTFLILHIYASTN